MDRQQAVTFRLYNLIGKNIGSAKETIEHNIPQVRKLHETMDMLIRFIIFNSILAIDKHIIRNEVFQLSQKKSPRRLSSKDDMDIFSVSWKN